MLPHEPAPQTTVQHQTLGNWVLLSRKDRGKESHCPQALAKGSSISNYSNVFATIKEAKEVTPRLSLVEQADSKHLTKKGDGGGCRQERRGCRWALPTAPTAALMQDSSGNRDPSRTCQGTSRWRGYGFLPNFTSPWVTAACSKALFHGSPICDWGRGRTWGTRPLTPEPGCLGSILGSVPA